MNGFRVACGALAATPLFAAAAHAHHAMGGALPRSFLEGLLSGLGHPIIGLDHLAFVVAVGLVAALCRAAYGLPVCFLAAMLAGLGLHLAALDLPAAEVAIALSVIVLGGLAVRARQVPAAVAAVLFAAAGLFHGYAYGESIIGAEPSPLGAYLIGLVAVQYAIAAGAIALSRSAAAARLHAEPARIAGGTVLGVGLVFLVNGLAA